MQILTNQVNPDSVLIDFEQSVISAIDTIYSIVPSSLSKCLSKSTARRIVTPIPKR